MQTELESGWFAIKMEPDDKDDYGRKQLKKVFGWHVAVAVFVLLIINNQGSVHGKTNLLEQDPPNRKIDCGFCLHPISQP